MTTYNHLDDFKYENEKILFQLLDNNPELIKAIQNHFKSGNYSDWLDYVEQNYYLLVNLFKVNNLSSKTPIPSASASYYRKIFQQQSKPEVTPDLYQTHYECLSDLQH